MWWVIYSPFLIREYLCNNSSYRGFHECVAHSHGFDHSIAFAGNMQNLIFEKKEVSNGYCILEFNFCFCGIHNCRCCDATRVVLTCIGRGWTSVCFVFCFFSLKKKKINRSHMIFYVGKGLHSSVTTMNWACLQVHKHFFKFLISQFLSVKVYIIYIYICLKSCCCCWVGKFKTYFGRCFIVVDWNLIFDISHWYGAWMWMFNLRSVLAIGGDT